MALIVGTNSYISRADSNEYFANRLHNSSWTSASDATKDLALVTASSLIDNEFQFIGVTVSASQAMAWPREGGRYLDPRTGRQATTNDQQTMSRVANATAELALHLVVNTSVLADSEPTFERIKVGSIEIEDSASNQKPPAKVPSTVKNLLAPLIAVSVSSNTWWRAN